MQYSKFLKLVLYDTSVKWSLVALSLCSTFVIKWLEGLKSNMQFHKNLKCENNFILMLMLHFINNFHFWI